MDILVSSLRLKNNLLLALDLFPNSMLESSRAFCIPCPRHLSHPRSSLLLASAKLVHQTVMCHRSNSFSSTVIFMYFGLETLCSLSRGFMRFHSSTMCRWISCHIQPLAPPRLSCCWKLLLHGMAGSTSRPSSINVFQWNRECFFLRYAELNSRFIVMTIDKVTLHRPNVGTCFSVICWF